MKLKNILYGALFSFCGSVGAYDLPPINLGFTNFVDGVASPAGPGWYVNLYNQYINIDELKDDNGNEIDLPGFDGDVNINLIQTYYQHDEAWEYLGGGKPGIDFVLPIVSPDVTFDGGELSNDSGVGDLLVGPWLSWGPYTDENGPIHATRVEFQMLFPTGKYDDSFGVNPGSNFFSFNPYISHTRWLTDDKKLTTSIRFHYLWNDKNRDPNVAFGPEVSDTQAGQAIHFNYNIAYQVTPKIRLGVSGYYLKQISDTEVDGSKVSGRKEKAFAIGPGLMYSFSAKNHIIAKAMFESDVENRPEGSSLTLRWVHKL